MHYFSRRYTFKRPDGGMFERFTDRTRKVMALANIEAQRLNHEYIRAEHILLGLIKEGRGVGVQVLKNLGVDMEKLRIDLQKQLNSKTDESIIEEWAKTVCSKRAIERAIAEAKELKYNYVCTEHMLLGLLRANDSATAKLLINKGLKLEDVRKEVLRLHKTDKE